jgi:PTS system mannitol-specific IIA component
LKGDGGAILSPDGIRLDQKATDVEDAVRQTGEALVELGAVEPAYVDSMLQRERDIGTYIGEGVAIPHGTNEGRQYVRGTKLVYLQFPEGINWNGNHATVAIGIASQSDEHVGILATLAQILMDPVRAERLRDAEDPDTVLELLSALDEEEDEESQ